LFQRIGLVGVTQLVTSLTALITVPIITKSLGADVYGIYVLLLVTAGLVPLVITLGLPYAMIRFFAASKSRREIQEGYYSIFFVTGLMSIITSILTYLVMKLLIASLFSAYPTLSIEFPLYLLFVSLNLTTIAYFRTFQQIKRISVLLLLRAVVSVVLVALFIFLGLGLPGAIAAYTITEAAIFSVTTFIISSEIGFKIPRFVHFREYLSFSLPQVPANLTYWAVDSSDRFVISILLGTLSVAYYSPAYSLGNFVTLFAVPFSFILPAALAKYYDEKQITQVKTVLNYSVKYFLLTAIPFAIVASLFSKPILTLLSTTEIAQNGYLVTPYVAMSLLAFGVSGIISNVMVLKKRTDINAATWILAALLNIGVTILLVPRLGIIGAAIGTVFAYLFASTVFVYYNLKSAKIKLDYVVIAKIVGAAFLASVVLVPSTNTKIVVLIPILLFCAAVYAGLLLLFKVVDKRELSMLLSLFGVKRNLEK
jgi:O-antigen/teichoic acid export membrane protein